MNETQSEVEKATTLNLLAQLLPSQRQLDAGTLAAFVRLLAPYTAAQVEAAAQKIVRTQKWFPTVADFVEAIEGSREERAAEAYALYLHGRRVAGYMDDARFDDPAIHYATYLMGGWTACRQERDEPFRRKEWMEHYLAYRGQPVPRVMRGLGDRRTLYEFHSPTPALPGAERRMLEAT